jgi:hypothetical protein
MNADSSGNCYGVDGIKNYWLACASIVIVLFE